MKPARERLASGSGHDDALLLMRRSATALAGASRCGEVSAQDVVETHIVALQRWQPKINALAGRAIRRPRVEADAADARIAASTVDEDELPPLLGGPCTIKEILNVAGLPHTATLSGSQGAPGGAG